MATKRVKITCGGEVDDKTNRMGVDQISQLPDPLIHHIFSFLPTIYLVRMSLLSKRWRHMWVSTPFIYFEDFRNITFDKKVRNRDMVLKFMSNSLRCRKQYQVPVTSITTFKCDTFYKFIHSETRRIDEWLSFAFQSKVKELDLHVRHIYYLPQFVLNASSLTVLKLSELNLEAPSLSTFPSLKVLSLLGVKSDAKSLQNVISGCPIIEDLYLSGFKGLNFTVSETLRSLSLKCVDLAEQWLNGLISGLPLLERLTVQCFQLEKVSIRSHSLKYFSFESLSRCHEAAVSMPNLVCLHFACFTNAIISIEATNLLEASLSFENCYMNQTLYFALVHLLSNLNCTKKLTLTTQHQQVLIFPKRVKKKCASPLPNLKHLKVKIHNKLDKISELRDSMLWCAPSVETLEIGH